MAPYRAELHVHCYTMLGSVHDADDALQDALLGAWRGLAGFEGRSSLQRARRTVDERAPRPAQRAELAALGADGRRELVDAFVDAWERADVAAILRLLAEDARFTMRPLPTWFLGRDDDVGRFFAERVSPGSSTPPCTATSACRPG